MFIDGQNYQLTNHGRKRYLERVGEATNAEMIKIAVQGLPGYRFVWKRPPKGGTGLRLVTVMEVEMIQVDVVCNCGHNGVAKLPRNRFVTLRCTVCDERAVIRAREGSVTITLPKSYLQERMVELYKEKTNKHVLVISETAVSTWNYHLRMTLPEDVRHGGGVGLQALCGKLVGWDTQIPLSGYGVRAKHIPENYCEYCKLLGEELGFTVGQ
jgi:hypothetical protein